MITDRLRLESEVEIERTKNVLARELKSFEAQLKSSSDVEIERLKSELQLSAVEHQIRFSKLHEKRAEVIAEIYGRLVKAQRDGQQYILQLGQVAADTPGEQPPAIKSLNELGRFIDLHRIYLPANVCKLLAEISSKLGASANHALVYGSIDSRNPDAIRERSEGFKKAFADFEGPMPEALMLLEDEFRTIPGVS